MQMKARKALMHVPPSIDGMALTSESMPAARACTSVPLVKTLPLRPGQAASSTERLAHTATGVPAGGEGGGGGGGGQCVSQLESQLLSHELPKKSHEPSQEPSQELAAHAD